jgi:hypothetical protein
MPCVNAIPLCLPCREVSIGMILWTPIILFVLSSSHQGDNCAKPTGTVGEGDIGTCYRLNPTLLCSFVSYYIEVLLGLRIRILFMWIRIQFSIGTALFNLFKLVKNSVFFSESVFRSSKGTECGSRSATLAQTS